MFQSRIKAKGAQFWMAIAGACGSALFATVEALGTQDSMTCPIYGRPVCEIDALFWVVIYAAGFAAAISGLAINGRAVWSSRLRVVAWTVLAIATLALTASAAFGGGALILSAYGPVMAAPMLTFAFYAEMDYRAARVLYRGGT